MSGDSNGGDVSGTPSTLPEREIVAIRCEGAHDHITRAKLADGWEGPVEDIIAAIESHEAHYYAQGRLARVEQCPDCLEKVLWA